MKQRMISWLLILCLLALPLSGCGGGQEEWLKDGRGEKPALLLNVETGPEETVLRVESAVLGETEAVTAGDAAARAVSVPGAEQAGKLTLAQGWAAAQDILEWSRKELPAGEPAWRELGLMLPGMAFLEGVQPEERYVYSVSAGTVTPLAEPYSGSTDYGAFSMGFLARSTVLFYLDD